MEELLKNKFKETLEIYESYALDEYHTPILCKIHDAFGGLDGEQHNCLGCNFAESQNMIHNFLLKHEEYNDIKESFTLYIITLYLLIERIDVVIDIIQLPDSYKEKHFKVFQQVRKWANFIKHPKAFILTHHPAYDFESSAIEWGKTFKVVINDQFVTEYYKGESDPVKQKSKNKELFNKLKNQKDIQVVFPDVAQLTRKVCYSLKAFLDLILNNQVYKDVLNDETTLSNYFENEDLQLVV